MIINSRCRICQSDKLHKVIDLGSQPPANAFLRPDQLDQPEERFPLEMHVCGDCNLAQLIHVVDKEDLFSDYIYYTSGIPKVSPYWQGYADQVAEQCLHDANDFVVEVGSNDGLLLWSFKEKGFRTLGVDPAKNIAPIAESRGVRTVVDFFGEKVATDIVHQDGKAKLIIGNNVIAHINDHHDLCRGIKALLADDGTFVLEAPYLVDMIEHVTFDTIYHEHLSFLAVRPLIKLFEQFGLEVFDVHIVPAQGQSIRVFVGHAGAHEVKPSVQACVAKELELGLDKIETYMELAKKVEHCKNATLDILHGLKSSGERIAGYGASAKGMTVLNYYHIGSDMLDFVMDELPSKEGLFTPGTHIPLASKAYAEEHRPTSYLLLVWNYLPLVLAKEQAFLAAGGKFILPTGVVVDAQGVHEAEYTEEEKVPA
ncbi:MAG: class I SAM-dependent methyltransferase [Candidatus Uhrbacteria bacterium]|nr:class I SAM-dependent methyltransferase [Candidatus Uhrbacteria bacterium]